LAVSSGFEEGEELDEGLVGVEEVTATTIETVEEGVTEGVVLVEMDGVGEDEGLAAMDGLLDGV